MSTTESKRSAQSGRTARGTFARGNQAARTHGAYSWLHKGRLPQVCSADRKALERGRKELEAEVIAKGLKLDAQRSAILGRVILFDGMRRMYARYIEKRFLDLSPVQLAKLATAQAEAIERRDRAMGQLFCRTLNDVIATPAPTSGPEDWSFPIPPFEDDDQ